jgi:TRAP-type C4-dicarboxylate transport system substrate-binding protein
MDGLQIFTGPNSHFAEARDVFEKIVSEFERKVLQQREAFETLERERLKKLGISGSAIRPNVKENQDWQQVQSKIRQSYDVKVNKLRKDLMQLIEVAS